MCGARCVQVHFPKHQAVRSDLLPVFLQSLTNPSSKLVESGSCPAAGTVNVLQPLVFCCFCKLHPQRQVRSPSLQVCMGPISWRSYTSAQLRRGMHRGIWFQPIPPVWFGNQGQEVPLVHPAAGYEVGAQCGAPTITVQRLH